MTEGRVAQKTCHHGGLSILCELGIQPGASPSQSTEFCRLFRLEDHTSRSFRSRKGVRTRKPGLGVLRSRRTNRESAGLYSKGCRSAGKTVMTKNVAHRPPELDA